MPVPRTVAQAGGDKARLWSSVCYRLTATAHAATGSKAAEFSSTGRDVTDSEQQHKACSSFPRKEIGEAFNHLFPNMGGFQE